MMTYAEVIQKNPNLLSDTSLDDATISALYEWFQFREVCDDVKFPVFYIRAINLYAPQYLQLMRIQTTEFDPMVGQYVERLIKDKSDKKSMSQGSITRTFTPKTSSTTERNTTRTPNLTVIDNGTSTRTPDLTTSETGNGVTSNTSSGTSTTTNNLTDSTDSTVTVDGESTNNNTHTNALKDTNEKSSVGMTLNGILPDSSSYPTGSSPTDQMPSAEQLNWAYADVQSGNRISESDEHNSTGTVTDAGTSTNNSKTETEQTASHTGTVVTSSSSDGETTVESTATSKVTGSDETATSNTRKETGTDITSEAVTITHNGSDVTEDNNDAAERETGSNTRKEISTGRVEAPQDMLARARDYVMKTNAFLFLIGHLDNCFYGVYNI